MNGKTSITLNQDLLSTMNKRSLWRLWAKALGEKASTCDKESDRIAIVRTFIFITYLITNTFIVSGVIRHWNDSRQVMKYQVIYTKIKNNKKLKKQVATFYQVEDAFMWEKHVKQQGYADVEVMPVF